MSDLPAITVAVDAMGGHEPPLTAIRAVAALSKRNPGESPVFFSLVGDEAWLTDHLTQMSHNPERINIVDAEGYVSNAEQAHTALAERPRVSVAVACDLVAKGLADAVVTAGHPGAATLSALNNFKLIDGVSKVALASVYPTARAGHRFSLLLDVGAGVRATADDLVCFAQMGSAYARIVTGREKPAVALLSNSAERTVGPPEVVEAVARLDEIEGLHFVGTVEGYEVPAGDQDVVVCEGFVGDVVLKIFEGASNAVTEVGREAEAKFTWRMGLRLLSSGLQKMKTMLDFEEYGGAPLLGVDRVIILCHPRSHEKAIANAVKLAIRNVRADLPAAIASALRPQ